ncbi:MAG TPA: hypothetical protein VGR41_08225 [Actinomycetota bacterium]|jgi:hypothetical protein|nr:hypothetical protein [Actinomycetota bacterium]
MSEEARKVWIRAHYERFPATVKGAFVLRGADRDPHQVVLREARVVEAAGGGDRTIDLPPAVIDVAPRLDFFVPFEFPITELGAGWYGLECDVDIDGSAAVERPGKRFSVAWPRATTRRGSVPIGRAVAPEGGPKVQLDQLDMVADSTRLQFSAEEPVDLRLFAAGDLLTPLDEEFDPETGRGRLTVYPAMRAHDSIRIEIRTRGKSRSEPAVTDVSLP